MAVETSFFRQPLPLEPYFSPRPWGGEALAQVLGKPVPRDQGPIGESWELSDHPDGRSRLAGNSEAAGTPLGVLLRQYPGEMIGRAQAPEKFPLLIKYIDATGDLSVQVHPDDAWCRRKNHPDRGKSECWYVMACQPGTRLIHGYRPGVTEERARRALEEGTLTELLDFRPIQPGDFIPVPPGTVHAMLAGTMICEIQQSSNTTFRLYDWDREPRRELHIDQSMEVTTFNPQELPDFQRLGEPGALTAEKSVEERRLLRNEFFEVRLVEIAPGQEAAPEGLDASHGAALNVVGGSGVIHGPGWETGLETGGTWFLPAAMDAATVRAEEKPLRVLVSQSLEI